MYTYSVGSGNELLWPLFLRCSYFGLDIYHIQNGFYYNILLNTKDWLSQSTFLKLP